VCVQVLTAVSESEGSPGLSAADAVHFTERMLLPLLHLRAVGLTAAKCPEKAALLPSHVDAPAGRNKARAGAAPPQRRVFLSSLHQPLRPRGPYQ
jgi:hypothetical protein